MNGSIKQAHMTTFLIAALLASAGLADTGFPDLNSEYQRQFNELERQLKRRAWFKGAVAEQALHIESLIVETDRDPVDVVLRRTGALLSCLKKMAEVGGTGGLAQAETDLAKLVTKNADTETSNKDKRIELFVETCRLRRRIAFSNPLLNFDRILFIKRQFARYDHMCDQYYGFNAVPGGGLYVLNDPFGAKPSVTDVLEQSRVERRRLKGRSLAGGSFLSPDLSYDGGSILFAYTQADKQGPQWSPQRSYHIFKVNTDGNNLEQLTDGSENDFDPCWLPDGRVVFVSERRGGFLRCGGRPCPTYTLHRMNADGTGIRCISFHETNEWQPTVTRDGMIAYTRWDYVDRDTNTAHHLWITTPDGRDPRAAHANYPVKRELRPWMEMDIRAVPGSHKYIATAAAHHGQAFGSLVMIDPRVRDDSAMSTIRRITPESPFPESEANKRNIRSASVYATAWPLSETFYLCAYDKGARNHGLYLVDAFGNRELLYRDKSIPCMNPIPIRPRRKPPVVPDASQPGNPTGTVAVLNVYDSKLPWPKGTKISELRVIQVLPKTTPVLNKPRIGIGNQTGARAVLGTVPVETDGSAHFTVPAGKPVFFQALDDDGMAVQSMRSLTYLQPGERLTCVGCHESRHQTPPSLRVADAPMAMKRSPSELRPEADGSNPFNYPRLVQPVLDRHCVECHSKHDKAPDLRGNTSGGGGWTTSYRNLAPKFGFYFNSTNGSIRDKSPIGGSHTTPGEFGARASRLLSYLDAKHHGVKLTKQERRRVTLWLDCNSDFYGAYENTQAQDRGEVVRPSLE